MHVDMPALEIRAEQKERLKLKPLIEQIIHRQSRAAGDTEVQLAILKGLSEEEIAHAINEAINYVSINGRFEQFHVGGNFVSPEGQANRGRRIVALDEPVLTQRYPFLRYLCLKVVPPETRLQDELAIQQKIQERLAAQPYNSLRIPLSLGEIQRPDLQLKAALMERLPRNSRNGSLQTLGTEARNAGISLRLNSNVEADVTRAFLALHMLGFEHRDTNDGNIYLTNAVYEEVSVPKAPGKIRPSHLRLITKAEVWLLDFERTHELPKTQPGTARTLIDRENEGVQDMLDPYILEIETAQVEEDLVTAVDDYYTRRQQRASHQGHSMGV
jgi:hypothetical protein